MNSFSKKAYYGADSIFFPSNLSFDKLQDNNKYKGYYGEETAVKIYYTLNNWDLEQYHKLQNEFKLKMDGYEFKIENPFTIDGKIYEKAILETLKLKNRFISYRKLLNKLKIKLPDKYGCIDLKDSIVSLQRFVGGKTIQEVIDEKNKSFFQDMVNQDSEPSFEEFMGYMLYLESQGKDLDSIQADKHNFEGFIHFKFMPEIFKAFPYYRTPGLHQISFENIKLVPDNQREGVLRMIITDLGGDIESLLGKESNLFC